MKRLSNLRGQARPLLRGYFRAASAFGANEPPRSIGGRLRAFLCSGGEGQSLIEFALVVPMLMIILTGIFAIGYIMQSYLQLTNAENQGVVTLEQLSTNAADPCATVAAAVIGAASNLKTTGANGIQMSITFSTGAGSILASYPGSGMTSPTGFSCTDGSQYVASGNRISLTVTYPSSFFGFKVTPSGLLNFTETEQI